MRTASKSCESVASLHPRFGTAIQKAGIGEAFSGLRAVLLSVRCLYLLALYILSLLLNKQLSLDY